MNKSKFDTPYLVVGLVLLVASGAFHLWTSLGPLGTINSDEAIATLMARDFRNGNFTVFYWGQEYGGSAEVIFLSLIGFLFGDKVAFYLVPTAISVAIGILTWRIAKRQFSRQLALILGIASTMFPPFVPWIFGRPLVFYGTTVFLSLSCILLASKLIDSGSPRAALLLGGLAGIAWWSTPQSLFFLIPLSIWLISRKTTRTDFHWGYVALGFLIGCLPWLVRNIRTGFASIFESSPASGSLKSRITSQFSDGWPAAFALKSPLDLQWLQSNLLWFFPILLLLMITGASLLLRKTSKAGFVMAGVIPIFVVLQTLAPTGGYVGSGRYYVFVGVPILFCFFELIGRVIQRDQRVGFILTSVFAIAMITTTTVSLNRLGDRQLGPTQTNYVVELLHDRGIRHIYGDYWVVYVLAAMDQDLKVSPVTSVRNPDWAYEVRMSEKVAWVFWLDFDLDRERLSLVEPALIERCNVDRIEEKNWVILIPACNPGLIVAEELS